MSLSSEALFGRILGILQDFVFWLTLLVEWAYSNSKPRQMQGFFVITVMCIIREGYLSPPGRVSTCFVLFDAQTELISRFCAN